MRKSAWPEYMHFSKAVTQALQAGWPVVALESTVFTHGLPYPHNVRLAQELEEIVVREGCTPATIALLEGVLQIGLTSEQLERLVQQAGLRKLSSRDIALGVAQKASGGTTVAGTLAAAYAAGIKVFATGGIGGVHRQPAQDISADLTMLAKTPLIVVSAGAKSILDLPATLEYLETAAVPVLGFQTDTFPAFYTRSSGLPVSGRVEGVEEVAQIAKAHWALGETSAILVVQPAPEEAALHEQIAQHAIEVALQEAEAKNLRGQAVTPFLLERVRQLSGDASLHANLSLLRNNAALAARIARQLYERKDILSA